MNYTSKNFVLSIIIKKYLKLIFRIKKNFETLLLYMYTIEVGYMVNKKFIHRRKWDVRLIKNL